MNRDREEELSWEAHILHLEHRFSIHSLGLKTQCLSPLKTNFPLSQPEETEFLGLQN
ncbi:MAG: hypothetical protein SAK29_43110 [Scytonema sp. PMC 1069.18]|nr:hypothetical protein [Scytonema sp. PMC 1069.18]MEC4887038.1 hypothetical protein [Scytonema sp. PMC 1070.18]